MKAVIRFIVELHGVQTRLRNYWLSIESLANSVERNCLLLLLLPPFLPPCSAAEKLIVDACKRDAQRFIIWKLEGPLTKGFFEEPNPLFARDVLLLRIKNRQRSSHLSSSLLLSILRTRALQSDEEIEEISINSWWRW